MRRSTAVLTSIGWFAVTAGGGAVLVPWWLTGWRLRPPLPYSGMPATLGMLLIVAGLIPAVHVFAQFVRAGGRGRLRAGYDADLLIVDALTRPQAVFIAGHRAHAG